MLNRPAVIEVFDRNFEFVDKIAMDFPKYEFDYISIGEVSITVPALIKAQKTNFITATLETMRMQAIITSVEYKDNTTKIKYKPILQLTDIDIYYDINRQNTMFPEEILKTMIVEQFVKNDDQEENIPGLEVKVETQTPGTLGLEKVIVNIYDTIVQAMKLYRIVVNLDLDVQNKKLLCKIGRATNEIKTIECDLKNIISASIVFKTAKVSYNKITVVGIYNKEDDEKYGQTEKLVFYQDKEGNVTTEPETRVLPVVSKAISINITDDFQEKAYDKAYKQIYNKQYDNYIKIEVANDDSMVNINKLVIGQQGRIIKNKVEYVSIFTGWERDKTTTLLFGLIRTEFTKNIRERRTIDAID